MVTGLFHLIDFSFACDSRRLYFLAECYNSPQNPNERRHYRVDHFRNIYLSSRRTQPNILAKRRQRRTLRRSVAIGIIAVAIVIGISGGFREGLGTILLSIGRAFAGLGLVGMGGLMIGVVITATSVFVYNGIFNGSVSLIDLDFIDEVPLIFAALGGLVGILWSLKWDPMIGLLGWGFLALVLNELIFKRPDSEPEK